jgi:hypothetical protein
MTMRRALFVLAGMLLWACGVMAAANDDVTLVESASVTFSVDGREGAPTEVALPFSWDRQVGAAQGEARFTLHVPAPAAAGPVALYLPRVGNSFRVSFNGQELKSFGALPSDAHADSVHRPQLVDVPQRLLQPSNVVEITIGGQRARGAGLSPVLFGPRDAVAGRFESLWFWQIDASRVVAIASAVLSVLALLVWLRKRDRLFLYYGVGELLWSIQTARVLFDNPLLPWPWHNVIVTAAYFAAPPLLCKFALAVVGRERGWLGRALDVLVWLALPASVAFLAFGVLWVFPAMQAAQTVGGLAMAVVVVRATWRSTMLEERVLCVAVALIMGSSIHDMTVLSLSKHAFELVPWIRFAWLGFALSMAWLMAERMRKDALALARLEGSVLEERQRIVRDLHDGLGSHLMAALHSAQRGHATQEELAQQLREAVDRLRITVDAMHEAEGDITAALAAVRHRLASRLHAAGVELQWDVEPLPAAAGWGVREAHHLQMLLYEALGNVIAHARATSARLTARVERAATDEVRIELHDDGSGFDPEAARTAGGKGLANMHARATALRGRLEVRSGREGTSLALVLPLSASSLS